MYCSMTHGHPCCSRDLDLDRMNLIYVVGLGILKMYLHSKNELARQTDTQTAATENITASPTRVAKNSECELSTKHRHRFHFSPWKWKKMGQTADLIK